MIKPVREVEPSESPSTPLSKTVKGATPSAPYLDDDISIASTDSQSREGAQGENCKNCGYPLNPQAVACPKCSRQVADAPQPASPSSNPLSGTIKPDYMAEKVSDPTFALRAIGKENEHEFSQVSYTGKSVFLNRDNLEPNNLTITSGEQAEIFQKDGKWHIVDHSAMKTTFKYVSEPTELTPGDIILLGNRKFKFELE